MPSSVISARDRTALFLSTPALWSCWPFLPVVRRGKERAEFGVLVDSRSLGLTGLSATVFFANIFQLPDTLTEFLALPHETFDSVDEVAAAGWCID
jgi:hypothetical protein